MNSHVTAASQGDIGEIRFSAPPYNFASVALVRSIADAVESFDADPAIRCLLLSAEGRVFCGGADLAGDPAVAGADGMHAVAQLYEQAARIFRRKKPIVAAVQDAAVGAGLGLALAADFRIGSPDARFSANFVRLGFHPGFALSYTLPRIVGAQKAAWMSLSAVRVKAEEALTWGLIDRLATAEKLAAEAMSMAQQIACNAPLALVAVRETLSCGFADAAIAAMQHELGQQTILKATADHAEGVASVFERRDARFIGR
jgi:enoyl-CoA hydratase/carnithine racemase